MSREVRTFRVGDLKFGLDVLEVEEIISSHPMARNALVAGAASGPSGARARVVIDIDLRGRLANGAPTDISFPVHLVVRSESGAATFCVDEIGDVIDVEETSLRLLPRATGQPDDGVVCAVFQHERASLHLIDASAVTGRSRPHPAASPRGLHA